ncbi:MAG: hypothetical protein JO079_06970 [Frankiaceae bacterium]|nr:hypothetical protein [Frankiaceae bacterium]MBV9369629.1 hypothetical protein [Frankiales bacterium]
MTEVAPLPAISVPQRRRRPARTVAGLLLLLATVAAGVALIVVAYAMAKHSTSVAHFHVFWAGFALVLIAIAVAGGRAPGRWAAAGLLVGYGVITMLPKFLMSPNGPVFFDEFGHIRHANDIVASGHLDVPSAYLPILRVYPGLEVLTAWLHDITGVSTWHIGQAIVLVAHCAVLLLVRWIARMAGLGDRAAFFAAIVYSLNPSYMYFDTQYAYESLGLPLCFAAVALAFAIMRTRTVRAGLFFMAAALAAVGACIVTHHVSAAVMVIVLELVSVITPVAGRRSLTPIARWGAPVVAFLGLVGLALWVTFVAPATLDYISPHVRGGIRGVVEIFTGHSTTTSGSARHQLFSGSTVPPYEKVFAYVAPALAGLAVLGALIQAIRDRRHSRRIVLVAPFVALAALYFVSLPLALTVDGGETAHRAWGYGYLGIAICAAYAAPFWTRLWVLRARWGWPIVGLAALLAAGIGNIAAGENVNYRFPGPYQFGTDTRSQTPELHRLASWIRANLPQGAKVVTDRFTGEVITSETTLDVPNPDESRAYGLYREGDNASPSLRAFLAQRGFRYWILDTRITTQLPQGKFFEGYIGPASINQAALVGLGTSSFLSAEYTSPHYVVLVIAP